MTYFGGKAQDGVYQAIINQIPMHDRYIELFLGGGAIMLKKKPAHRSIGVEIDEKAFLAFPWDQKINPTILNQCVFQFLSTAGKITFTRSTFVYVDPPYPHETRGKTRYKHELTDYQHIQLLNRLRNLSCSIAISTYPNPLYSEMLSDWRVLEYNSTDRSGKARTENLFMNYPEPLILHDNRYIGENAGSRQDIKRRIVRTKKRLLGWNSHERQKLLQELCAELPEFERKHLCEQLEK
jgi:site-specific DNA-adenine methylase